MASKKKKSLAFIGSNMKFRAEKKLRRKEREIVRLVCVQKEIENRWLLLSSSIFRDKN